MKKFAKMAIAAAVAGFSFAASASILIDDFSTPNKTITDVTSGTVADGVWDTSAFSSQILGGYRDIYATKLGSTMTDPDPDFAGSGVQMFVHNGSLSFNTATNDNAMGIIRWDGANTGAAINAIGLQTAGVGVDLSSATAFAVTVLSADLGFPFALEVYTDATHWSRLIVASDGMPGTNPIDFADFAGIAGLVDFELVSKALLSTGSGGSADFSNVGALQAIINLNGKTSAVDLSVDLVQAVPEPESLALVGLGLLGLAASRRRKAVK